jgi:hypothetical protein
VKSEGTIDCGFPTPGGTFISVSAGVSIACGVKTDGSLACWGALDSTGLPQGTFTSVSVGEGGCACAVKTDGNLSCWDFGAGGGGGGWGGNEGQ